MPDQRRLSSPEWARRQRAESGGPLPTGWTFFFDLAFAAGIIAITGSYAYKHSGRWDLVPDGLRGARVRLGVDQCLHRCVHDPAAHFHHRHRGFARSQMGVVLLLSSQPTRLS